MTTTMQQLLATVPQTGRLEWIGVRTDKRGAVAAVDRVEAVAGLGLEGDHRTRHRQPDPRAKRQVTLIQAEHLEAVDRMVDRGVTPDMTRRNLVVSGINLRSLKDRRFRVGGVVLEGTGECHPCSRMEETLGPGGYQAMRGHGGLTARVVEGGTLEVGAEVIALPLEEGTGTPG